VLWWLKTIKRIHGDGGRNGLCGQQQQQETSATNCSKQQIILEPKLFAIPMSSLQQKLQHSPITNPLHVQQTLMFSLVACSDKKNQTTTRKKDDNEPILSLEEKLRRERQRIHYSDTIADNGIHTYDWVDSNTILLPLHGNVYIQHILHSSSSISEPFKHLYNNKKFTRSKQPKEDCLWLNSTLLTGTLPSDIGNLSELKGLKLQNNRLSGTIPNQLGNLNSLQTLQLIIIPSELGKLNYLLSLNLSSNALSGTVPMELATIFSATTEIYLYNNEGLEGDISFLCENGTHRNIYANDSMKNVTCQCCVY